MPSQEFQISSIESSIERPVAYSAINQVMTLLRIPHTTPIRFYGRENANLQPGTAIEDGGIRNNIFPNIANLTIGVSETYDANASGTMQMYSPGVDPIFKDPDLFVTLTPVRRQTQVRIDIQYNAADKTSAESFRNRLMSYWENWTDPQILLLNYRYIIPDEVLTMLSVIHALRERQGGYGQTVEEYLSQYFSTNVSTIKDVYQTKAALAAIESQGNVIGYFDMTAPPEQTNRENEVERYSLAVPFTFVYQKVVSVVLQHPVYVHNQKLPSKYIPVYRQQNVLDARVVRNQTDQMAFGLTNVARQSAAAPKDGVAIPPEDKDWIPGAILPATIRIATICARVANDPRDLLNLEKDMQGFAFTQPLLDFLKQSENQYLNQDYQSVFQLSLYQDFQLMPAGSLVIDNQLNVRTSFDMNIRKTYRLRFSVVGDFDRLSESAKLRIKAFPGMAVALVAIMNEILPGFGSYADIGRNKLTLKDLISIGIPYDPASKMIDENHGIALLPTSNVSASSLSFIVSK